VPQMSFSSQHGGSRFCCQIITAGLLSPAELLQAYSNVFECKILTADFPYCFLC